MFSGKFALIAMTQPFTDRGDIDSVSAMRTHLLFT